MERAMAKMPGGTVPQYDPRFSAHELTPEEIEEMKKNKPGMFQKIRNMLGYKSAEEE